MYSPGKWNIICDVCGWEFKSTEVRKRWDGLIVCHKDWEPDHPQKFLRVRSDPRPVPFIRDEPEDTFTYVCYMYANQAYADIAEADCAQADLASISYARAVELKGSA